MNKEYQEAFNEIKEHITSEYHWWSTTDRDKYLELLQEAIDKANKYDEKETPKKPTFLNYGGYKISNWHCPVCAKIIHRNEDYCITCGQHLDWSDE